MLERDAQDAPAIVPGIPLGLALTPRGEPDSAISSSTTCSNRLRAYGTTARPPDDTCRASIRHNMTQSRPPSQTIHVHLTEEGCEHVPSVSTIWRVLKRRGLVTPEPHKRPRSSLVRFEAALPNERWQSDVTHWRLAGGSQVDHARRRSRCPHTDGRG